MRSSLLGWPTIGSRSPVSSSPELELASKCWLHVMEVRSRPSPESDMARRDAPHNGIEHLAQMAHRNMWCAWRELRRAIESGGTALLDVSSGCPVAYSYCAQYVGVLL